MLISLLVVTLICAGFVALAWLQTQRFILTVTRSKPGTRYETLIKAPAKPVEFMLVQLPDPAKINCDWQEIRSQGSRGVQVQMIDWDTPTRKLRVDNFADPQRINLLCDKDGDIFRNIRVQPPSTEIFEGSSLNFWRIIILITGVGLWAIGTIRLAYLLR